MEFLQIVDLEGATHLVPLASVAHVAPPPAATGAAGAGCQIVLTTGVTLLHADAPAAIATTIGARFGASVNIQTY